MYFSVAKTIATALVSSRLECCNSLYHNIALKDKVFSVATPTSPNSLPFCAKSVENIVTIHLFELVYPP